jgi:hypothetical protein
MFRREIEGNTFELHIANLVEGLHEDLVIGPIGLGSPGSLAECCERLLSFVR